MESIELPMENKTNKRRGFCFITFKEEDPVKRIMEKKYHNIGLSKVQALFVFFLISNDRLYYLVFGVAHIMMTFITDT